MTGLSLTHLIRKPAVSEGSRPPLILLLHGIGSNEHDLMGLAPTLDKRFLILSVRAPLTLQPGSFAWYPTQFLPTGFIIDEAAAEQSRHVLLKFVDEAIAAYDADPNRVYLMGFSQGCIMSIAAGLTAPRKFAGIVGMSGRLLPGLDNKIAPAEDLRGMPVLLVHGTADSVIPVSYAREMRDKLKALGVAVESIEYPMGHQVSQESFQEIQRWLAARLEAVDWRTVEAT